MKRLIRKRHYSGNYLGKGSGDTGCQALFFALKGVGDMEKKFYTTAEVCELLRIKPKTLHCYRTKHKIYESSRPGFWYASHVDLLVKVWAGFLTEDEAYSYWYLEKERTRKKYLVG